MALLVSVSEYRTWAGAAAASVPDSVIANTLDEAESGMCADLGVPIADIQVNGDARNLAVGEEMRRASRLLARRSSPEAISGYGEASLMIPSRDPDSLRTLVAIRNVLGIPEAVA